MYCVFGFESENKAWRSVVGLRVWDPALANEGDFRFLSSKFNSSMCFAVMATWTGIYLVTEA